LVAISLSLLLLFPAPKVVGAEPPTDASASFLGAPSCGSTSCHGGAADNKHQNLIWSRRDFHSRSYATLTSARSERFADMLKLAKAVDSPRCTVCHAPFHSVPENQRTTNAIPAVGVSCENCHGPAGKWIRAHTRPDLSHADRVAAGMRDLKNFYVRANTCVACHQTLDRDIAAAGHPELIFELDGQSVTEPKHWTEKSAHAGPQAWLVGQAVALREMSWQLSRSEAPDENLVLRWNALRWLLQKVNDVSASWPDLSRVTENPGKQQFVEVQERADIFARRAAGMEWTEETTRKCLAKLCATATDFQQPKMPQKLQSRRAERLALALDRLGNGLSEAEIKRLDDSTKNIFQLVQSFPTFDSRKFAEAIQTYALSFQ
jgi:hypothetical protein